MRKQVGILNGDRYNGNIALVASIIVIVAITFGIIGFMLAKKTEMKESTQQQIVKQEASSEKQPTSQLVNQSATHQPDKAVDWKEYSNQTMKASFLMPSELSPNVNNESDNFYDAILMEDSPNYDRVSLQMIKADWLKEFSNLSNSKTEADFKEYVVPSEMCTDNGHCFKQIILSWKKILSTDGKQDLYVYKKKFSNDADSKAANGVAWVNSGRVFLISNLSGFQTDLPEKIALTFKSI